MSEWLGKSRITEDDIKSVQPTVAKHFPMLVKYYVNAQKLRVMTILDYEEGEKFKRAVINTYGSFNPTNIREAGKEAIGQWIEAHLEGKGK